MSAFAGWVGAVLWKDILVELRARQSVLSMVVFAALAVVALNFALDLRVDNTNALAPGIMWVVFTFAAILGLNRSMSLEKDNGCLEGLLVSPVDRSALFVAKLLANLVFVVVVEVVCLFLFVVLFGAPLLTPGILLVVVLGTIGLAAAGTVFSGIAVSTRAREVMLPILLLPVATPLLIAAVKATAILLDGGTLGQAAPWLELLVAFDLVFVAVGLVLFEHVISE